jgi:hypothetical protein
VPCVIAKSILLTWAYVDEALFSFHLYVSSRLVQEMYLHDVIGTSTVYAGAH